MFKNSGIIKCKILKYKISQFHLEAVETGVVQKKTNLIGYSDSGAAFMEAVKLVLEPPCRNILLFILTFDILR